MISDEQYNQGHSEGLSRDELLLLLMFYKKSKADGMHGIFWGGLKEDLSEPIVDGCALHFYAIFPAAVTKEEIKKMIRRLDSVGLISVHKMDYSDTIVMARDGEKIIEGIFGSTF